MWYPGWDLEQKQNKAKQQHIRLNFKKKLRKSE